MAELVCTRRIIQRGVQRGYYSMPAPSHLQAKGIDMLEWYLLDFEFFWLEFIRAHGAGYLFPFPLIEPLEPLDV